MSLWHGEINFVLKYFSPFAAVKIGKKKCVQSFVNKWLQMIEHPFFVPIFTAAKDKKYFKVVFFGQCSDQ